MNIALINGSPKPKRSGSGVILNGLRGYLNKESTDADTIQEFFFRTPHPAESDLTQIADCDALVFAFPLYVDGIPSHLIASLAALEQTTKAAIPSDSHDQLQSQGQAVQNQAVLGQSVLRTPTVYAIVNCGFHEGHQTAVALKMMEHWCDRAGLIWGQGLGVGAGGMLVGLDNVAMGQGPRKSLGNALEKLARSIVTGASSDTVFTTANFPRMAYKLAAEHGWRKAVKSNGLTAKDLFTQR